MNFKSTDAKQWLRMGPRAMFGQFMINMAKKNKKIMVLSADLGRSSGLDRFKKEFLEGQLIHSYFRLYNVNEKLFHLIGALFDDDNNICAMYETVEGHVDMSIRKIAPMPQSMITNMLDLKEEHSSMGEIPYDIRLKIKTYKE